MIPPILRENRNFRRYFIGQSVSLLGDQVTLIALPLTAVLVLHASAGQMGALTTAYLVPNLLFSLSWAQLYIVSFLTGSLGVFFSVAYGGFFQVVVPRSDYVQANSLIHGSRAFSFVAGNSIGGILVQVFRGPYALALDAGSFLWSAFFLGKIDAEEPPGAPRESGGLLAGARWIRHNAIVRAELFGVATLNLFNFMFFALFVLYATREFGVRPATLGFVLGAASVGTLLGSFVAGHVSRRLGVGPSFIAGCFLVPAPLILVPAASGPHWLVLAFLFVAELTSGVGLMLLDIMAGSISAGTVPMSLRSRVSGAFGVVNNGVRPLGTALGGLLGATIGVRPTLWIATAGALLGLLWFIPSPIQQLREVPEVAE